MKFILLLLLSIFTLSVRADQNLDIIKNGKLIHSTTRLSAGNNLTVLCSSNRNVVLTGSFTDNTNSITFNSNNCTEGTRFLVHHTGTGIVNIRNASNTILQAVRAAETYVVYYHGSSYSVLPLGQALSSYGTIPVASGGTGRTSLTANAILVGNGTSPVSLISPNASGDVLTWNGSTLVFQAPSGGSFDPNSSPSIIPTGNLAQNLGSSSKVWNNFFIGTITAATNGSVNLNALQGLQLLAGGPVVFGGQNTVSITTTTCPAGSCTAASPLLINQLSPTTTCTQNSDQVTCKSTIIIELSGAFNSNTADKYVCIQGITRGYNVGQRLRIEVRNRSITTGNRGSLTGKVANFIVGFASPKTPITGCPYTGGNLSASPGAVSPEMLLGHFVLKYTGVAASQAGGAYPAANTFLPREQFIMSSINCATTGCSSFPYESIGSTEFEFAGNIPDSFAANSNYGWHQL